MKRIKNEFLDSVLDDAAWSALSSDYQWTEPLLEKCKSKVNWRLVCSNRQILWTPSMLEKFQSYIEWEELSDTDCETILTADLLDKYKDLWDWPTLSENNYLTLSYQLIDRFIDYWDWSNLIDRYSDKNLYTIEFLERYADKIPLSKLQNSALWHKVINQRSSELFFEITL